MRRRISGLFLGALLWTTSVGATEPFIAGTAPAVRPATAPLMEPLEKNSAWFDAARQGVDEPYPDSLKFLNNQGRWYTPFTHRGMPDPYDIRGLHD